MSILVSLGEPRNSRPIDSIVVVPAFQFAGPEIQATLVAMARLATHDVAPGGICLCWLDMQMTLHQSLYQGKLSQPARMRRV